MQNRLLFVISLIISLQISAQYSTYSPYSTYGFGERGNADHYAFTGVGNSSVTFFDSTIVNFFNPSTYNTLGKGQPLFSIGLGSRISFYDNQGVSEFHATAMMDHFAMAIPVKKHFGLAFGLKPYSKKGYEITDRVKVGDDSLKYTYLGKGGVNQAFLGLSGNIFKFQRMTLSVGGNLGYLFGTAINERRSQIIALSTSDGGVDQAITRVSSFHYEVGSYFQYRDSLNRLQLTLGATIEPAQQLTASRSDYLYYASNVTNPNSYDTLYANEGQSGRISIAPSYTLGLGVVYRFDTEKKGNRTRNSEVAFHGSFTSTDWTSFSDDFGTSTGLLATSRLTFGVQFIPERKFYENAVTANFFEKTRYRIGYYQYTLPYAIGGEQVSDFGTTFGFGFPILAQQSLSSLNVGFSLGKRGTGASNSLNERYIGVNFGVTLAPSNFDRWFRKRKLD